MDERPWEPSANPDGLVAVVFARDENEAEHYCELLEDHDIPAFIGVVTWGNADETVEAGAKGAGPSIWRGVPVLVPEVLLDEAGEVVADHDDTGDFQFDDELEDDDEFEFTQSPDGHIIDAASDGDNDDDPFDGDRFLDDEDDEDV